MKFEATILRKMEKLPRYIVVKAEHVAGRGASFAADVSLNGSAPFRRNIHPWGKGSDAFFFNLTAQQCKTAGVDTGQRCTVSITPL